MQLLLASSEGVVSKKRVSWSCLSRHLGRHFVTSRQLSHQIRQKSSVPTQSRHFATKISSLCVLQEPTLLSQDEPAKSNKSDRFSDFSQMVRLSGQLALRTKWNGIGNDDYQYFRCLQKRYETGWETQQDARQARQNHSTRARPAGTNEGVWRRCFSLFVMEKFWVCNGKISSDRTALDWNIE